MGFLGQTTVDLREPAELSQIRDRNLCLQFTYSQAMQGKSHNLCSCGCQLYNCRITITVSRPFLIWHIRPIILHWQLLILLPGGSTTRPALPLSACHKTLAQQRQMTHEC